MHEIERVLAVQRSGDPERFPLPKQIIGSLPARFFTLLEWPRGDFREYPADTLQRRLLLCCRQDGSAMGRRDENRRLMAQPGDFRCPVPPAAMLGTAIGGACVGRDQQLHATGPLSPAQT